MPRCAWTVLAVAFGFLAGCSAGDYDGDFGKPIAATPPDLFLAAGTSSMPDITVGNSQTGVPVLQIRIQAGSTEDVRIDSMQVGFDTSKNGVLSALSAVYLFQDSDANGYLTVGFDVLVANTNSPAAVMTFLNVNRVIPAGQTQYWLVAYDFNGNDTSQLAYSATFAGAAAVSAQGYYTGLPANVQGGALNGRTVTTEPRGSLHLLPGIGNPAPADIQGNETNHLMMHLRIDAGAYENVTITMARFTHTGTGNEGTGIAAVRLYRDIGTTPGAFDAGDTLIAGPLTYSVATHKVLFSGLSETVIASNSLNWLLLYDFSGTSIPGVTFAAQVAADADLTGTGVTTLKTITPSGAPFYAGQKTIPTGRLAVAAGANMPPARSLTPQIRRSVIQFTLTTSGAEGVSIGSIAFTGSGTGSLSQIQNIILARESVSGTPGEYDATGPNADPVLLQNVQFVGSSATFTFGSPYLIPQNSTEIWILAIDWPPPASGTYRVSVDPAQISATASSSGVAVTPSGAPIQGNTATLTPAGPVPTGWNPIVATGSPPATTVYHSGVYDAPNQRVLFFGGAGAQALYGSCINSTTALAVGTVGGEAWTTLSPTGTPPAARMAHAACYDSTGQRMIVFGGYDNTTPAPVLLADTHALSLSGGGNGSWSAVSASGSAPVARAFCTACYDSVGNRVVVFGGNDGTVPRNDVHVLSLAASPAWSSPTTSGTPPVARYGHAAALDTASNTLLVFGGFDGTNHLNDTFSLDLSTWQWTQVTVGSPPGVRREMGFGFDTINRRFYLFGGWSGTTALNDVRYYSFSTAAWSSLSPSGTAPAPRLGSGAAFDTGHNRLILFGGASTSMPPPLLVLFQDVFDLR